MRERREILNRVTRFDDFSVCWESDQATARGLVAQVRDLVNVKDSFTRMNLSEKGNGGNELKSQSAKQRPDVSGRLSWRTFVDSLRVVH